MIQNLYCINKEITLDNKTNIFRKYVNLVCFSSLNQVMHLAADILSKIPEPIDYESTERNIGANKTPLDVVLLQEVFL